MLAYFLYTENGVFNYQITNLHNHIMEGITAKKLVVAAVAALVVGILAGYWYGGSRSYQTGYDKAVADAQAAQEALAQKAAEDAAKAANPFQKVNPLEGVTANPFEKTKDILNPF